MVFLEREKGLLAISPRFAAACQPFGLALTAFASSAKFVSSHFVHEPNFVIRRQSPVLRHGLTPHPYGLIATR